MLILLYSLFILNSNADTIVEKELSDIPKASAAVSLFRNTGTFQKIFEPIEHGTLAHNSDLVFKFYSVTEDGGGVTKFQIQNNNGDWIWVSGRMDTTTISSESKVRILIYINPNMPGNNKVTIADAINHEVMVHGAPFLKTLSVLRDEGSTAFLEEWNYSSLVTSWDNANTINAKYNGPFVGHALVAMGMNQDYNHVTREMRKQLKPREQALLDAVIKDNPHFYGGDLKIYKSFLERH